MTEQQIPTGSETGIEFCCVNLDDGPADIEGPTGSAGYIRVAEDATYHYTAKIDWGLTNVTPGTPPDSAILAIHPEYYAADGFGLGDCPFDHPWGIYRGLDDHWMGTCVANAPPPPVVDPPCPDPPEDYNADQIAIHWGMFLAADQAFEWDTLHCDGSGSFAWSPTSEGDSSSPSLICKFDGWVAVTAMVEAVIATPQPYCANPFGPPPADIPRYDNAWVEFYLQDGSGNRWAPSCRVHFADTDPYNNTIPPDHTDPEPWVQYEERITGIITAAFKVTDGADLQLYTITSPPTGYVIWMVHGDDTHHQMTAKRITPPEVTIRFIVCDNTGAELYEWDRAVTSGFEGVSVLTGEVALHKDEQVEVVILHDAGSGPAFMIDESSHLDLHKVMRYPDGGQNTCES